MVKKRSQARPHKIRPGTLRDVPVLMHHRMAMQRELGRGVTRGHRAFERFSRRWLVASINSGRVEPFLAVRQEGRVVGSGSIWLREDRPHQGEPRLQVPRVHGIYVEPRARRQGIATDLLRQMIRWIRKHGFRRASLRTTSRAESLYLRFGFRRNSEMLREW